MLGDDHRSGASEILEAAAGQVLARLAAGEDPSRLAPLLVGMVAEQPAMAALERLASRALEVARDQTRAGTAPDAVRREVEDAVRAFAADFAAAGERVVQQTAAELLPSAGWVATTSRSSLVERAFLAARAAGKRCGAIVAESRPEGEGRTLAARLAAAEVPVLFGTDAALALLAGGAGLVLVGADAVRPRSFVNKVGTAALLWAAREAGLEAHALAQTAKFLPADAPLLTLPMRDPKAVWESPPPGVRVANPNFEEVALSLLRSVVTERGFLPPGEAGSVAANVRLAEELLAAPRA